MYTSHIHFRKVKIARDGKEKLTRCNEEKEEGKILFSIIRKVNSAAALACAIYFFSPTIAEDVLLYINVR
jgi:hypothetical protein